MVNISNSSQNEAMNSIEVDNDDLSIHSKESSTFTNEEDNEMNSNIMNNRRKQFKPTR